MKKMFLLFVVIFTANCVFGVTNTQIANFMLQNKNCNLKNSDLIYPGQPILFNIENDLILIYVKKGDCFWSISKKVLEDYEIFKKSVVIPNPIVETKKPYVLDRKTPDQVIKSAKDTFPKFGWVTIILIIGVLSYLAAKNDKNEAEKVK